MADDHGEVHVIHSVPEFLQKLGEAYEAGKYVVVFYTNSQPTSQTGTSRTSSQTTSAADACRWNAQLSDIMSRKTQIISHDDDCRRMSPIFIELSTKYTNLLFLEVDFFQLPDLMNIGTLCQVKEVPSFAFFKPTDSQQVFDKPLVGADKEELESRCMQ